MKSHLTSIGRLPVWDESLMNALSRVSASLQQTSGMIIGIEDDAGAVYRIVHTSGLCETVRVFESARQLGFGISAGQTTDGHQAHRVLRRAAALDD